jgi:hypothetical protein
MHFYRSTREYALENIDRKRLVIQSIISSVKTDFTEKILQDVSKEILELARQRMQRYVDQLILKGVS